MIRDGGDASTASSDSPGQRSAAAADDCKLIDCKLIDCKLIDCKLIDCKLIDFKQM